MPEVDYSENSRENFDIRKVENGNYSKEIFKKLGNEWRDLFVHYTSKIYHKKENTCKKRTPTAALPRGGVFSSITIPRFTSAPKDTRKHFLIFTRTDHGSLRYN